MKRRPKKAISRRGFSAVEAVVTLSIGMLLLSLSARAMGPVQSASAVRSADEAFRGLVARARSLAIEQGTTTVVGVDPAGDSAWVTRAGVRIEGFRFHNSLGVDLRAPSNITLCLTPRGVADPNCANGMVSVFSFVRGSATRSVNVLPLGQVVTP